MSGPGRRRTPAREDGQATVELVALLPLLLIAGLAGATILAAQSAAEQAGQAAQAGAMALLQDANARTAAREALPPGARDRAAIAIDGHQITVRVRPRIPLQFLEAPLTATETADAGPEPPK